MTYNSGVNEGDVRDEYETNASTAAVERAIRAAEATAGNNLKTGKYDGKVLDDLVTYLACHYVAGTDPTVEADEVSDSSNEYEAAVGEGLRETRFGRRALALDHTGDLDATPDEGDESFTFETFG